MSVKGEAHDVVSVPGLPGGRRDSVVGVATSCFRMGNKPGKTPCRSDPDPDSLMTQTMQHTAAVAGEVAEIVVRREGGICATGEVITAAGLSKTFPGGIHAVMDLESARARRRDLRPARAQRRRQDDHGRDALDARRPDRGERLRGRGRRRRTPRPRQADDRRRGAVEHARPQPDRLGEPVLPLPVLRPERHRRPGPRRPAPRAVPAGRPGEGERVRALRRHGAAPHGGAQHRPLASHPLP